MQSALPITSPALAVSRLGRGICGLGFVSHPHLQMFCMDCSLLLPEGLAFDTVLFPLLCTEALFSKVGVE